MPTAPRRGHRAALATTALAVLLALAASCTGSGSGSEGNGGSGDTAPRVGNAGIVENEEQPKPGGKLIYGLIAESNGWNPSNSQWAASGLEVAHAMFDTLSMYDTDSKIQPFLAESFTPNPSFTEWRIKLRPGITFHNGKPVTADVVAKNQTFLKESRLTQTAYKPIDSFSTDGDLVVVVKMNQAWVNYPYALSTQIGVVVDNDWLTGSDANANPIGTGPFAFDHWTRDKELLVTKNPHYWRKDSRGNQLPFLDSVEFRPIPNDSSRSASLQNGDIQVMQTTDANEIIKFGELGKNGEFQVFNETKGETVEVFVQLNGMAPPFDDVDARRALAYATDKQLFIDTVDQGLYEPANGPFPPSSRWYTSDVETTYPQFDQAKARELVEKVKAKNGGKFEFKLAGPPIPTTEKGMAQLQSQWKEVGIEAIPDTVEQAPLIVQVLTGGYQAVLWQQFDSPHPLGDSIWWHPESAAPIPEFALNFARNKDEEIGKALDDARHTPDPKQELSDYQTVQRRLAEDVPYIWLYHSQISVVAANNLVNVVSFTLPPNEKNETKKGMELLGGSHQLAQVWIKS
jgi:peptide/nickel transport system substrate-binding protein